MYTVEQLADILEFKREVMTQVPLVSTLLAGLAMSGMLVLISGQERGRLRACLLVGYTVATLVFILTTVLDASMLPAMKRTATMQDAGEMQGLISLSRVVVWGLLAGIGCLMASVSGMGFLFSRRVGWWTLGSVGVLIGGFAACCLYLDAVMRR